MPIEIWSAPEIEKLRRACAAAKATLDVVEGAVRAGMSTKAIDELVRADTKARGGTPSQLGYEGFPAAVCTSRNDVVCHGIPSAREFVGDGDIINVDVTTCLDGFHGDTSRTFLVGPPSADARRVVEAARACLHAGIAVVKPGARLGDVGAAIVDEARRRRVSVVRDFGGHGIGRAMHMEPHVSHVAVRNSGPRLVAGMAFTIEPMVNLGRADVRVTSDGWRVVTSDGSLSAQFEHTVVVVDGGVEVLTA